MSAWTSAELDKIGKAEELTLSSLRRDGTLRKPVIMWVVRVDGHIYVRAYKGRTSPWFCGAQTRHQGSIQAGSVEKGVVFVEESNPEVNRRVDAAYLAKYARYPQYVAPMVEPAAKSATLELIPTGS